MSIAVKGFLDEKPKKKLETKITDKWDEKYRPKNLNDISGNQETLNLIKKFIDNDNIPHLLLYGPPGTGKTTTTQAWINDRYGMTYAKYMTVELNASIERGIDAVRQKIFNFVMTKSVIGFNQDEKTKLKVVVLDELDAMTPDAQASLRKIIEEYSSNARFILICNDISKVSPALQSRCIKIRFSPINKPEMVKRITYIAKEEKVNISKSGIEAIVKYSDGDMRQAINILQTLHMIYKKIDNENTCQYLGYPSEKTTEMIMNIIKEKPYHIACEKIFNLKNELGMSINDIIQGLHEYLIMGTDKKLKQKLILLSEIEYNASYSVNDWININAIVGILKF